MPIFYTGIKRTFMPLASTKMNKGTLAIAFLCLGFSLFAQKFDLQLIGYKPVVYEVDSVSALELYNRAMNWVDQNYEESSLVLADNLEGKSIRINAYARREMKYQMHKYDFEYTIYLEFKEGRYRINFEIGDLYTRNGDKSYSNSTSFFKKDGTVKQSGTNAKSSLDLYFNTLADEIYQWMTDGFDDHLQEVEEQYDGDDW